MSDYSETGLKTVRLLPNEIKTSPRFNVRPFSSEATEPEDRRIERMAASIEQLGQLDDLIITPDYVLVAGHRRRRAAMLVNERRSARGQPLIKLNCKIDNSTGDLRRKAIQSNIHRKDNSPMDLAYLIYRLRQENHWEGHQGAIQVADYLGVDKATVYQHERFLTAEKELQNQLHNGIISAQSCKDLLEQVKTAPARAKAIERAAEIQVEDRLEKNINAYKAGKKSIEQTTAAVQKTSLRIEHPAVVKAIREVRGTVNSPNPKRLLMSRSDLIQSISQFDADNFSPAARAFARYWAETFSIGNGSTDDLIAKFRAIPGVDPPKSS